MILACLKGLSSEWFLLSVVAAIPIQVRVAFLRFEHPRAQCGGGGIRPDIATFQELGLNHFGRNWMACMKIWLVSALILSI